MAVANKLAPTSNNKPKVTFTDYIAGENIKKKINEMVGGKNSQRFITAIVNEKEAEKVSQSVKKSLMEIITSFQKCNDDDKKKKCETDDEKDEEHTKCSYFYVLKQKFEKKEADNNGDIK